MKLIKYIHILILSIFYSIYYVYPIHANSLSYINIMNDVEEYFFTNYINYHEDMLRVNFIQICNLDEKLIDSYAEYLNMEYGGRLYIDIEWAKAIKEKKNYNLSVEEIHRFSNFAARIIETSSRKSLLLAFDRFISAEDLASICRYNSDFEK